MILNKLSCHCFLVSVAFLFFLLKFDFSFFSFCYSYFSLIDDFMSFSFLVINMDFEFVCFFFMVHCVTFFVSKYSSQYMESYNNKKFFFLLLSFFISMLFLSASGSIISLMVGWDGLGITSLLLIMFYPNKSTLFNSFLTSFFNRLGDVLLMISLSFLLYEFRHFFFFECHMNLFLLSSLILCSFTKSAQFPLSSWLPAAMSAPTPISAMVHSSTLVTAGVFLLIKIHDSLLLSSFSKYLLIVGLITFLIGGFLSNLELDFKKIVAFSTMSQISMIIFFSCSIFIGLSITHMIFHAFFKTLLFSACGLMFVSFYSIQTSKNFFSNKSSSFLSCVFLVSIFSMSGFIFSSSFYSKDLFLELMVCNSFNYNFFLLLSGSSLTILYCFKIFNSLSSTSFYMPSIITKKSYFFSLIIFSFLTFLGVYAVKYFFFLDFFPSVSWYEVNLINLVLIFSSFMSIKCASLNMAYFPLDVFFMKTLSFSMQSFSLIYMSKEWSDLSFFKPSNFFPNSKISLPSFKKELHFLLYLILAILVLF